MTADPAEPPPTSTQPDLEHLTGLRSGKQTFYPEFRGAAERLERVAHALETVSWALVQTVEGPTQLVRAAAEASRRHLNAEWVLIALSDGALPQAQPRHLILDHKGRAYAFDGLCGHQPGPSLPDAVLNRLNDILRGELDMFRVPAVDGHHAHVPIELDGQVVGAFAAWTPPGRTLDATDSVVMRILASQTAVALQNAALFDTSQSLLDEAEHACAVASRHASELARRNVELLAAKRELDSALRTQILEAERRRIGRELHDSVTQCVLSAGMQIEVCRGDITNGERAQRLDVVKSLTGAAVEQLRAAIFALTPSTQHVSSALPDLLEQLCAVYPPEDLRLALRIDGRPVALPGEVDHALMRIAGEALFNTAVHAGASRADVRLTFRPHSVSLSVSDDGDGDPRALRTILRKSVREDIDGRHRGLANMKARATEFAGTLSIRRADKGGGVRIAVTIPLPIRPSPSSRERSPAASDTLRAR